MIICLLRSLVFSACFALWTIIVTITFSPFLIFRYRPLYWAGITWCRVSLLLLKIICGIRTKVTGHRNLPKSPYIVASKHQSAFETVFFWNLFYIPTFILKKELTKLPFFGIYLIRMKMICIDRSAGASSLKKIISEAADHVKCERKIIIYPEGTRIPQGQINNQYNPGVFALYKSCNIPVVPVALNSGAFWPSKSWLKRPGTIEIMILPPIKPGLQKDEFMKRLNDDIEINSLKLYEKSTRRED